MRKLLLALVVLCMAATSFATVSTNAGRNEYTATAGQTIFNYTFKIYADTDLSVYITASGAEPNDSADITTAYTVTGAGLDAGGSITLDSGATLSDAVTIVSTIPTSRTVDYQFNGDFRADVVNNDFDRAVSLVKQIEDANLNTLRYQNSVQGSPGFLLAPEAGNVIGYDGAGAPTNYDLAVDGNSWDGLADLIDPTIGKGSDLVAHTSTALTVTETLDAHGVTLGTLSDFESISLSTDGTFIGNSDTAVPSEKAAKTYIDTSIAAKEHIQVWAIFSAYQAAELAGTFDVPGTTTITLTITAHGLAVGEQVWLDFSAGVTDAMFTIATAPTADTFTVELGVADTKSGTVEVLFASRDDSGVASFTRNGVGDHTVTFSSAFSTIYYSAVGSCGRGAAGDRFVTLPHTDAPTTGAIRMLSTDEAGTPSSCAYNSVIITGTLP